MYSIEERAATYKRATLFFILYSAILFFKGYASFWAFHTALYFFVGFLVIGLFAGIFMTVQYKIETKLHPNYWFFNILIEVVGFGLVTYGLFFLMH